MPTPIRCSTPTSRLWPSPHPPENYRSLVKGSRVTRAAAITIAPPNNLARTRARNDRLLQLAEDSGGFFYPVCSVHPADGRAALDEIDRVAADGAAWLKLHPNTQEFDVADPAVADVVKKATENGLPVLFDAYSPWDANQPGKFVNLAMAVPDAKLILAHAHGPGLPAAVDLQHRRPLPGVAAKRLGRYFGNRPAARGRPVRRRNSPGFSARSAPTGSSSAAITRWTTR